MKSTRTWFFFATTSLGCTLLLAAFAAPAAARLWDQPLQRLPLSGGSTPATSLGEAGTIRGQTFLETSAPTVGAGVDVGALLGADAFYSRGITGQGTRTANVEGGHIWNAHETLLHVNEFAHDPTAWDDPGTMDNQQKDLVDYHATAIGMVIGGRTSVATPKAVQTGIAPGTNLASGAIATNWVSFDSGGFDVSTESFAAPYAAYFRTADVINSSWGFSAPFLDEFGADEYTVALDGLALAHPGTTLVIAAGNEADPDSNPSTPPVTNTVAGPASGYNSIAVGALENNGSNVYESVADFSSRGPQAFYYIEVVDDFPVLNYCLACRAAVDIVSPGTDLRAAAYLGPTGQNNPTLPDTPGFPAGLADEDDLYFSSLAGTSVSAPIVAGAAALIDSASYNSPHLAANARSRDSRVVKAVLLNSADKIPGWTNNPVEVSFGGPIFSATFQSLDYTSGAGALNIGRAYEQYLGDDITQDVPGTDGGSQGLVAPTGWDFGLLGTDVDNFYLFDGPLAAGTIFDATLTWYRQRTFDADTFQLGDLGQADLDLYLVDTLTGEIVAASASAFNTVEHIHFRLPATSQYALRVNYFGAVFGETSSVEYGLAWSTNSVPEPTNAALLMVALAIVLPFATRTRPVWFSIRGRRFSSRHR
jgi:hypothetical protein